MSKYIADYILQKEFRCRCCGRLPPDFYVDLSLGEIALPYLVLFKNFKDVREEWNKPTPIRSGYRCEEHNLREGGERVSVHMFGLALDLDTDSIGETQRLAALIQRLHPEMRMGVYTGKGTFIHIDVAYLIFPRYDEKWKEGVRWSG